MNYALDIAGEEFLVEILLYRRIRIYRRIFKPVHKLGRKLVEELFSKEEPDGPWKNIKELRQAAGRWSLWLQKAAVEFPFVYNLMTLFPEKKRLRMIIAITRKIGHCSYFRWETEAGLGDAALTAIGTGVLWAVKIMMFQKLHEKILGGVYILDACPRLSIKPVFGKYLLRSDLEGIFHIRAGYIIINMFINSFYRLFSHVSSGRKALVYVKKTGGMSNNGSDSSN